MDIWHGISLGNLDCDVVIDASLVRANSKVVSMKRSIAAALLAASIIWPGAPAGAQDGAQGKAMSLPSNSNPPQKPPIRPAWCLDPEALERALARGVELTAYPKPISSWSPFGDDEPPARLMRLRKRAFEPGPGSETFNINIATAIWWADRYRKEGKIFTERPDINLGLPKLRGRELWWTTIARSNRKQQLLGRPCPIAISANYVVTPFEDRLLDRSIHDGGFGEDVLGPDPRIGIPEQVVPAEADFLQRQLTNLFPYHRAVIFSDPAHCREIRLVERAKPPMILNGHATHPWRAVFSPDGLRLASCSLDGNMRLWDAESGKQIASYPGPELPAGAEAQRGEFPLFSPDGRSLGTVIGNDVLLCRASDGAVVDKWTVPAGDLRPGGVTAICFTPDSRGLFAFMSSSPEARVEPRFYRLFPGETPLALLGTVRAIAGIFLPDGIRLVTRNEGPDLAVWDTEERQLKVVVPVAKRKLYDVTLTPSRRTLAIVGDYDRVRFLDINTWEFRRTKRSFRHRGVDFVAFDAAGDYMITGSDDGCIKCWRSPECAYAMSEDCPTQRSTGLPRGPQY